jgi:hypothetical protein
VSSRSLGSSRSCSSGSCSTNRPRKPIPRSCASSRLSQACSRSHPYDAFLQLSNLGCGRVLLSNYRDCLRCHPPILHTHTRERIPPHAYTHARAHTRTYAYTRMHARLHVHTFMRTPAWMHATVDWRISTDPMISIA